MARDASALLRLFAGLVVAYWLAAGVSVAIAARVDVDYRLIDPQPAATRDRIEVVEFFWYGCPFCYDLQPALAAWLQRKPADVVLRRIPAVFRPTWVPGARLYYTLEALGAAERLHRAVYDAYHRDGLDTDSAAAVADWAARHGIDREKWLAAYHSDEVEQNVERARALTAQYQVAGTPSLIVDGRYLTSSGMTPTVPAMIPILEDLVVLARQQRKNGQ